MLPPGDICKADTKFVEVTFVAAATGAVTVVITDVVVTPPAAPNLKAKQNQHYNNLNKTPVGYSIKCQLNTKLNYIDGVIKI